MIASTTMLQGDDLQIMLELIEEKLVPPDFNHHFAKLDALS